MRRAAAFLLALGLAGAVPLQAAAARHGHGHSKHRAHTRARHHHAAVKRGSLRFTAPRVQDLSPRVVKPSGGTPGTGGSTPGSGSSTTPTPTFPTTRLSVRADEYSLTLSSNPVVAGDALVELANAGEDAHNIRIVPLGDDAHPVATFPVTAAAARSKVRFKLTAGSYEVYCTLLDHRARGMDAVLTVR
jgi:plastocyanin